MEANLKSFCYYLIFCKRQLTVQIELAKTLKSQKFQDLQQLTEQRENIVRI